MYIILIGGENIRLSFLQFQFAVSEEEHLALKQQTMTIEDIPMNKLAAILTKEIDIGDQATPHIGEYIFDTLWPKDCSEQEVISVSYSYSANLCIVTLAPFFMVANSEFHNTLEKTSELHGWKYQKA